MFRGLPELKDYNIELFKLEGNPADMFDVMADINALNAHVRALEAQVDKRTEGAIIYRGLMGGCS